MPVMGGLTAEQVDIKRPCAVVIAAHYALSASRSRRFNRSNVQGH
jgi:hypothetical protein